jgi:hypothetical protein
MVVLNVYLQFATCRVNIRFYIAMVNPLNAELNPIRHLLALVGAHHFVHVSRIRVNVLT